ncbi:MAG: Holliday junction branch migration protein RuvA [Sphingomonadaceae bacterium]
MIASLKGVVQAVGADHAVVDVGGIGYLVHGSSRMLGNLSKGAPMFLLVETQVREDSITLFGFAAEVERDWFRLLTGVQGVGGRLALAILGTLTPDELGRAVTLEDRAMIARAPGVGPRLAARILTELKGKGPAVGGLPPAPAARPASATPAAEAVSALAALGFREPEAARAVAEAERELGEGLDTPALVREALKRAGR